jgi:ribosome-binding protein aMBF1 (putative translation factor)
LGSAKYPKLVYPNHGYRNVAVPKSMFTRKYDHFRALLVEARKSAGVTQVELASRLRRPQSFVSKVERGERRLDLIEFLEVARVLKIDVSAFLCRLDPR